MQLAFIISGIFNTSNRHFLEQSHDISRHFAKTTELQSSVLNANNCYVITQLKNKILCADLLKSETN